jgi:Domain of unknown function (DUF222)
MGTAAPAFASATDALDMVRAGLRFLAAADATQLTVAEQAKCLLDLERANSVAVAARTSVLGVFNAKQGYAEDGDYSSCSWLRYRTQVTQGTSVGHTAWVKRAARHPAAHAALGAEAISESYAREICWWTDKLPEDARPAADDILLGAAASGLELADLAGLAGEMYERSRQDKPDTDGDTGDDTDGGAGEDGNPSEEQDRLGDDRSVNLATTIGGAGIIRGNLTPECAEFVKTVLDALSAPSGADDDRSHEQRYHDGLQEAMKRLVASGLVPEQAGQPLKVWAYISLADLMLIEGSSALLEEWTGQLRARWAGHRAAADEAGGHQGLWLDGDDAQAIACDASVTPVVVGDVNPGAFEDLVRLCVQLDKLRHGTGGSLSGNGGNGTDGSLQDVPAARGGDRSGQALEQAIIGQAVELLSGPGGLASFLRRKLLDARLTGPSLPLDIGYSDTVPASIRNAVRLRDRHCQWAGGCSQPAAACQVHHTRHKANGGKTSLKDCVLLCAHHHQVMIHRKGWTLVVNPDGTTTAWNKDKTKVLHSHGPPARAG